MLEFCVRSRRRDSSSLNINRVKQRGGPSKNQEQRSRLLWIGIDGGVGMQVLLANEDLALHARHIGATILQDLDMLDLHGDCLPNA